ncbi:AMP-binding protein [Microbacterium arabinogalactanolyticum]|uniref:AMP-binding protein n=1 Tax=Microbacterium arabinogalactanolyticum TaxID=69365 RepID=UPI004044FE30
MTKLRVSGEGVVSELGFLHPDSERVALRDSAGRSMTHAQLAAEVLTRVDEQRQRRTVKPMIAVNSIEWVVQYLTNLYAGHVVCPLNSKSAPLMRTQLQRVYGPHPRVSSGDHSPASLSRLALLMPTSGTTGNPKLVRLSVANLRANADQIVSTLGLSVNDVGVTSLPTSYIYGLSIIHSHLKVGATISLTADSVLSSSFWDQVVRDEVTTFAGVPTTYDLVVRRGLDELPSSGLVRYTAAGGRLNQEYSEMLVRHTENTNASIFRMYGQTEASPRMSCLRLNRENMATLSVGAAVPGGEFTIRDNEGSLLRPGETGEIWYQGENVMLGYSNGPDDLNDNDMCRGLLSTGDLGYLDETGECFITGRLSRIAKINGVRINLDDLEHMIPGVRAIAREAEDQVMLITHPAFDADQLPSQLRRLCSDLGVNRRIFRHLAMEVPITPNGKVDYAAMADQADHLSGPVVSKTHNGPTSGLRT